MLGLGLGSRFRVGVDDYVGALQSCRKNMTLFWKNKSFAAVTTATVVSKMTIGELIKVSRVTRIRVRFSNVLRGRVEG